MDNSLDNAADISPDAFTNNSDQAEQRLRDMQAALISLGYRIGDAADPAAAIDGRLGPQTREALTAFQGDYGLQVHGKLDDDTYDAVINASDGGLAVLNERLSDDDDWSPVHAEQALHLGGELEILEHGAGDPLDDIADVDVDTLPDDRQ